MTVEIKHPLPPGVIFCFGSNKIGVHGRGAAWDAHKKYGAVWGKGEGFAGQSYAIPTKDHRIRTLPLSEVEKHVDKFLVFARSRPDLIFALTPIGTGLCGYQHSDIAPLFADVPANVILPQVWGGEGFAELEK